MVYKIFIVFLLISIVMKLSNIEEKIYDIFDVQAIHHVI